MVIKESHYLLPDQDNKFPHSGRKSFNDHTCLLVEVLAGSSAVNRGGPSSKADWLSNLDVASWLFDSKQTIDKQTIDRLKYVIRDSI